MKIELTTGPTRYLSSSQRKRFYALDYIGIVTVDDVSSQLAYNRDTGRYISMDGLDRYHELDTAEVSECLLTAKPTRSPGRTPIHDEPMKQRGVMLTDGDVTMARHLGKGNISRGIRWALQNCPPLPVQKVI